MSYRVFFHTQPREFLNKVDAHIAKQIRKRFERIREYPFRYLESFSGADVYKLRIGEYRALVDMNKNNIDVVYLEHRKKVYKRYKK